MKKYPLSVFNSHMSWSLTSIPLELTPGTKSDARSVLTDCLSHCLNYFEGRTSAIPDRTTVLICANVGYFLYKMIDEGTYIRIRLIMWPDIGVEPAPFAPWSSTSSKPALIVLETAAAYGPVSVR